MSLARKVTLNASALAAGRMVATVLGIVSVGLSTRYLGVEGFGALAAALAFSSLLNMVTDAGLWTIGTREIAKRPQETQKIFGNTLALGLGLSVLGGALGVAVALLVYSGEDDALTREGILLLLLTVPLSAPFGAVHAYFIAQQQAWVGSLAMVLSSVVQVLALALATGLDWGFTGVAGAYVAGALAQGVLIVSLAAGRVSLRPSWDPRIGLQILRWAIPLSGATILHSLYWRIDIILLSLLASDRQVGLYGVTYRVIDALAVLPQFVMVTLLPEFARLADRRDHLREITEKALSVMQIASLGILATFAGFAGEILAVVAGPQFVDAERILQVLVVGVSLGYSSSVLAQVLVAVNRQVQLLRVGLTLLPVNVALNLALIPIWGALGAAVAFAISEVLHLSILGLIYRSYDRLPRPQRLLQVLVAAVLMGAVAGVKLLPFLDGVAPGVLLIVGVPVATLTYVGALYALDAVPLEIHTNLVAPIWNRLRPS